MLSEVVTLAAISTNLPPAPERLIHRDNLLQFVENAVAAERQLIILQGEEGSGKTTLLSEFVRSHPNQAFSIFVSGADRLSYHPDTVLLQLCSQLFWFVHETELSSDINIDESLLARLMVQAQTKSRQASQKLFFVIDGVSEIPPADSPFSRQLTALIPPGRPGTCIIASSSLDDKLPWQIDRISTQYQTIPGFSLDESKQYFADLTDDIDFVTRVQNSFRGLPGQLSAVPRLLEDHELDVRKLVTSSLETRLEHLFELGWQSVDTDDRKLLLILGVLAHDRRRYTLDELCQICLVDIEEVRESISTLAFLEVNPGDQTIRFVSDEFQRFVESRLKELRDACLNLIIEYLLRETNRDSSITELPHYLDRAGRFEDQLDSLSSEHISRILEVSQSIAPVRAILDLGARAARRLDR
jgi:hypothetical protein